MLDTTPGEAGRGTCRVRILDSQPFGEHESLQPARPVLRNLQDGKCGCNVFWFLSLSAALLFCVVCCFSADSAVVEVLQPANLSHLSLVFGPCADHFASIKDLRQEHVTELILRQYTESFYGFLWHFAFTNTHRLS